MELQVWLTRVLLASLVKNTSISLVEAEQQTDQVFMVRDRVSILTA